MPDWGFYGRREELRGLERIFARNRWFFVKITGRRRIGKTSLVREALGPNARPVFYVQVPDSDAAGVLSAVADAMDLLDVPAKIARPTSLAALARVVGRLARDGYVVALDEFQYFQRQRLRDFCSMLQGEVDALSREAATVRGGLLVLGSIFTEMSAILEDRGAPLFNRLTDSIELTHLDGSAIKELLEVHADASAERFLFLWTLFEGVPKFYRDCFEQDVLAGRRTDLLDRLFFLSSSPLRGEAENWFLKELHGRYDLVLKYLARHPGCVHGDIVNHVRQVSAASQDQFGGYLKVLTEKYRLVERKMPVFATKTSRQGRYYLTDNFLQAWLSALAPSVAGMHFGEKASLVRRADDALRQVEGCSFERLVGQLYEERGRKGVGDFRLTRRIQGYWNRQDTEIDLVAVDDTSRRIRFGSCKRSEAQALGDGAGLRGHVRRFLAAFPDLDGHAREYVVLAPTLTQRGRQHLADQGLVGQDLGDLLEGL